MSSESKNPFHSLITFTIWSPIIILSIFIIILCCKSGISNAWNDLYIIQLILSLLLTLVLSIFLAKTKKYLVLNALILSVIFSTYTLQNLQNQAEKHLSATETLIKEQKEQTQKINEITNGDLKSSDKDKSTSSQSTIDIDKDRFWLNLIGNIFNALYMFLSAHLFFVRDKVMKYLENSSKEENKNIHNYR